MPLVTRQSPALAKLTSARLSAQARWMRWRTYQRLAAMDEALEDRRLALILGG